ncbi:MAG: S41 family peptidase [Bacteroidales bacterium]|nr:S41 family peptidase [Bacteroidales bacterium]
MKINAILLFAGLFSIFHDVFAGDNEIRYNGIKGLSVLAGDVYVARPEKWTCLYDIPEHIGLSQELTDDVRDSLLYEINQISGTIGKDSLMTSDIFRIYKPYFDWLRYVDPHYRVSNYNVLSTVYGSAAKQKKALKNNVSVLPFNVLNINDTLIVWTSLDSQFQKGDMVKSINGIPISELLKYNYTDRRTNPDILLRNYFAQDFVSHYDVDLIRGNKSLKVSTSGYGSQKNSLYVELAQAECTEKNIFTYSDTKVGYISIPRFFPDNSRIIRLVASALLGFQKNGIENVILDLRGNPGGNGDRFDELLSLFIQKDSIPYMKNQKIKLNGVVSEMSKEEYCSNIVLDKSKYMSGMKYYVLMDISTGSIAASFCNILQYNNAAVIVGEPLLHNALKYGETVRSARKFPNNEMPALFRESGISIVEYDEYTKAVDGVLVPDIHIPYVAKNYMTGKDAMLDKLLEIIRSNK